MSILEASPPARGLVREVGLSEANSRVTGKQEATPKCPQSRVIGKFELSGAKKGQVSKTRFCGNDTSLTAD